MRFFIIHSGMYDFRDYIKVLGKYDIKEHKNARYFDRRYSVDISSIEELRALIKDVKYSIIFDGKTIEIYDDYRE